MKIESSVSLAKHASFRTGGPARFFVEVCSVGELKQAIESAREKDLPFLILGEGTNVLISDEGFGGFVIRPMIQGIDLGEDGILVAGSGEHWDDVVALAVSKNLAGIENLSLVPGSVGAAPVQNIGAYGTELKDVIEWVEVFNPKDYSIKKISRQDCFFGYRESLFKTQAGRNLIITRVAMKLVPDGRPNISYKDLQNYFSGKTGSPTIAQVRQAVIEIRTAKLPDVKKVGTAGSFFKNPVVEDAKYKELQKSFPDLPSFPAEAGFKKIPLAWVLDKVCGLKGKKKGDVGLYENQPLALVNYGKATTEEIKIFAKDIADIVKAKTGISIEWEVNLI